jgi:hypothetical protein
MRGDAWAEDLAQDTSQVEIASEVVANNEDAVQDADVDEYIEDMDNSWGCEKLTDGEIVAAKALLGSAEEILNEDKPVKYEDISFKKGLLWVSDIGYPSQDFYVRFAKDEKFRNLGALLGCHITVRDIPVAFEGKYPTVEDRVNKIEKELNNCGMGDINIDDLDELRRGTRNKILCIRNVAYKFFDEFENTQPQVYRKNFDVLVEAYDNVYNDMISSIGYCSGRGFWTEDEIQNEIEIYMLKLVQEYIKNQRICAELRNFEEF